jgi:hypothetical protein
MTLAPMYIDGIGLLGPGLPSWPAAQPVLRGEEPHAFQLTVLPAPPRLPPAERRRAGPVIRLAMAVAEEAIAHAQADPSALATVFSSSGGEGSNCHSLCETLASDNPLLSPTRFTNSVHNAASGYWHIAVGSRHASTSLCAFDGSFGAGLLEAAVLMHSDRRPLMLVAYDLPYPEPLNTVRPLPDNFGLAFVLSSQRSARSIACCEVATLAGRAMPAPDACADPSLEALRTGIPAGAALPMLQAIARADAQPRTLTVDYLPAMRLRVVLTGLATAQADDASRSTTADAAA